MFSLPSFERPFSDWLAQLTAYHTVDGVLYEKNCWWSECSVQAACDFLDCSGIQTPGLDSDLYKTVIHYESECKNTESLPLDCEMVLCFLLWYTPFKQMGKTSGISVFIYPADFHTMHTDHPETVHCPAVSALSHDFRNCHAYAPWRIVRRRLMFSVVKGTPLQEIGYPSLLRTSAARP